LDRPYQALIWETKAVDVEIVRTDATPLPPHATPPDGPLLLSAIDAAKALGVSTWVVYGLIRRGQLRHLRLGRVIRIPRAALVTFIEQNSEEHEHPPEGTYLASK
jgi:excisionase family DNA binding protein